MKEYIQHIPYFFLMVSLGIITNLLMQKRKTGKKITGLRILEEIFSSIWISLIVAGCLDYFTDWSVLVVSGISSLAGFFHSKFIDYIGNDILLFLVKLFQQKVSGEK